MSELVRILSLSGGGIRGIFQSTFLQHLEADLGAPLARHFDLICGTSTGGIVALSIAHEIPLKEMSDLYRHHGRAIFTPKFAPWVRRGGRYSPRPLADALKGRFGTARFGDLKYETVVTTAGLENFSGQALSTRRNPQVTLLDAALATAAAPTYFPPARITGSDRSFIDGGIWANDPSLVAIMHAQQKMGATLDSIRILAIGTGDYAKGATIEDAASLRPLSVGSARFILDFLMSAQEAFSSSYAKALLPEGSYRRYSPQLSTRIGLDDARRAIRVLPPKAEQMYDEDRDRLQELFEHWRRLPAARGPGVRPNVSQARRSGPPVVYWCGPHNQRINRDMKVSLENLGFEVRLPDDLAAGLDPKLASAERAKSIQRICRRAIEESDVVVVNLATYGLDSAWEMGYAEALNKTVVGFNQTEGLKPVPREVNKRYYRHNFMHGWDDATVSESLDELAVRCRNKVVYLFCPYANTEAIRQVEDSKVKVVASQLIVSNERLGIEPDVPETYSERARSTAVQFLRQADVILAVLPRYGMDTAWKLGFASAIGKELIGWETAPYGGESSRADYFEHWMHGWRKKVVVSTITDLARFIRGGDFP